MSSTRIGRFESSLMVSCDAWLLEPDEHLAVPVAQEGDPLPVHIEETDKTFAIEWVGTYHIDGPAFVYTEKRSGRVRAILGYPTRDILNQGGS